MKSARERARRDRRRGVPSLLLLAIAAIVTSCTLRQTRDVVVRGEPPASGYGAYGYVILSKRAAPGARAAYVALCEEFLRLNPDRDAASAREKRVLTLWTLRQRTKTPDPDCNEMIDAFDYEGAQDVLDAVGLPEAEGAVLVAAPEPFSAAKKQEYLVLDMSGRSADDVREGMRGWSRFLTKGPDCWNNGWRTEKIRLALRSAVTWVTSKNPFTKTPG